MVDNSRNFTRHLMAAKLNLWAGSDPTQVMDAVTAADALLARSRGRLSLHVRPTSALGQEMLRLVPELAASHGHASRAGHGPPAGR